MVSLSNLRLLGNATVHILHNMIDLHGSILSSAATLVKCVSVTVPASNDFTVAGTIDHLPPFVIHNNTVLGTTDDYAVLDISSSSLFSAVAFQRLLQFWAAHSVSNDMSNASLINVVLGVASQGLIGVIIGIAGGITPIVNGVGRFDVYFGDTAAAGGGNPPAEEGVTYAAAKPPAAKEDVASVSADVLPEP